MADNSKRVRSKNKTSKKRVNAKKKSRALTVSEKMYQRSGEVSYTDPLVGFLYTLMRDYVPTGIVEEITLEVGPEPTHYSNGWLAQYANDLAERLRKLV